MAPGVAGDGSCRSGTKFMIESIFSLSFSIYLLLYFLLFSFFSYHISYSFLLTLIIYLTLLFHLFLYFFFSTQKKIKKITSIFPFRFLF